jgi:hypothetical protein
LQTFGGQNQSSSKTESIKEFSQMPSSPSLREAAEMEDQKLFQLQQSTLCSTFLKILPKIETLLLLQFTRH